MKVTTFIASLLIVGSALAGWNHGSISPITNPPAPVVTDPTLVPAPAPVVAAPVRSGWNHGSISPITSPTNPAPFVPCPKGQLCHAPGFNDKN